MIHLPRSLKTQVATAIALLTALFAASALYSMHVIDQQHNDDVLLQLAARLQFSQQHLAIQAMGYRDNAPRDYPSYYRDLKLYFVDLKRTRAELDRIIEAFRSGRFDRRLMGEDMTARPALGTKTRATADELATLWKTFSDRLDERIGTDTEEPRLEWAAQWITDQHPALERAINQLATALEAEVATRAARANRVNRFLLAFALLVALGIALWFYWRVLRPLATAVHGFGIVANGDFAHQVPVVNDDEIGAMASAFNHLAGRLDALRRLLTRLEQGGDLAATLRTMSESLPNLMPVDWIGMLVVGVDGRIHLQHALSDGKPDPIGQLSFDVEGTVLAECIDTHQPLHVADVAATADLSEHFVFLRRLLDLGRRDALFLPITATDGVQGVAVIASRYPNSYRSEHLELLRNIRVLLGVSLGRTIQLAENKRLATIGQFASGIAHEIRNPLATIDLALQHLQGLEGLPESASKRVDLASGEVARLEQLLGEILLYAKPLVLAREPHDFMALVREVVEAEPGAAARTRLDCSGSKTLWMDRDRIRQVLINLLRNALQAAPENESIEVGCQHPDIRTLVLELRNGGEPIRSELLPRLFEPFVTSKSDGTGLGLAIAERIVNAHGGALSISSTAEEGTRVTVRLPLGQDARPHDHAASED